MTPLLQCCVCNRDFQTPQEPTVMMLACCHNILHIACAKDWSGQQQNCMRCRQLMDLTHAGKPFAVLWKVLEIAAKHHPKEVQAFFDDPQKLDAPDTECAACLEEFPELGIDYIPGRHCFAHSACSASLQGRHTVHLSHLATLVQTLMEKHNKLKENLFAH